MHTFLRNMVVRGLTTGTFLLWLALLVGRFIPVGQIIPFDLSSDIYLLETNRRIQVNLTQSPMQERSASIAPNADEIVYTRDNGDSLDLYLVDWHFREQTNLTASYPNLFFNYPTWSPDGRQIAYVTEQPVGDLDIFVMDVANSRSRRMTNNRYGDNLPVWSPDGRYLVYVAANNTDTADLWVLDTICAPDCSPRPITAQPGIDFYPSWSPDGKRIAFISNRGGDYDIYILSPQCILQKTDCTLQNPIGLRINRISGAPLLWSTDGLRVIFRSGAFLLPEVYEVDADCYAYVDGCQPEQITQLNHLPWARRLYLTLKP